MPALDGSDVSKRRLAAQLLGGRQAGSVESVAKHLVAIQAQDPRGAYLAFRTRTSVPSYRSVEQRLTEDRTLVISWLNRGTLHLVRAEDFWWLHDLTQPQQLPGALRRLHFRGVTNRETDQAVEAIVDILAQVGRPLKRSELRDQLERRGIATPGDRLTHYLAVATARFYVIRGPRSRREDSFVRAEDWIGARPAPLDPIEGLSRLTRRYLASHGPASPHDLARWAAMRVTDARTGFRELGAEIELRDDGLLDLRDREPVEDWPDPQLLGSFDETLHGWVSRDAILNGQDGVVTSNGIFRPFALVAGAAVATWSIAGGTIVIRPFEPLRPSLVEALTADGEAVLRYLELQVHPAVVL